MRTATDWEKILNGCGVRPHVAVLWSHVFADTIKPDTFSAGEDELVPFVAQMLVETGRLEHLVENLNYSAERMMQVWPKRFPTLESALPYAGKPEALANYVYGGRMGNLLPGDGWRYRGRGIPMITGYDGYAALGKLMGQDLLVNPELLEQPHFALEGGVHWWENRIPDSVLHDVEKVTKLVNGGTIALAERVALNEVVQENLA